MTRFPFVLLLVTLVCIWAVAGCGGGAPTVTVTPKSARDLPTNTPVPRTYDPDPIGLPDDATWLLEYLDGRPVIAATFITLRLRGYMLEGVDGCNSFASQPGEGNNHRPVRRFFLHSKGDRAYPAKGASGLQVSSTRRTPICQRCGRLRGSALWATGWRFTTALAHSDLFS